MKNRFGTIIWLKFDRFFFHCKNDLYLCALYLWTDESPLYNVFNVNLFNLLEQDVFHFNQLGSVFLAGNFKALVGHRLDYIYFIYFYIYFDRNVDGLNFIDVSIDKPTSKASMDNTCNTRGNILLDLCKSTSLSIGNGRLGSDKSTGTYTYFTKHACSTTDHLLLSNLTNKVRNTITTELKRIPPNAVVRYCI